MTLAQSLDQRMATPYCTMHEANRDVLKSSSTSFKAYPFTGFGRLVHASIVAFDGPPGIQHWPCQREYLFARVLDTPKSFQARAWAGGRGATTRQEGRNTARQSGSQEARQPSRHAVRQACSQAGMQSGREAAMEAAMQPCSHSGIHADRWPGMQACRQTGRRATG